MEACIKLGRWSEAKAHVDLYESYSWNITGAVLYAEDERADRRLRAGGVADLR